MSIIGGMLEGLGKAGVQAGAQLQQQFGAEDLLKMRTEAEKELQANMQEFHRGENAASRQLTRDENAASRQLTREEGAAGRRVTQEEGQAGRRLSLDLATMTDTRIKEEGAATRAQSAAQHSASINLQRQQLEQAALLAESNRPLQQDKEGNYFFKDNKGQVNYLYDPSMPEGGKLKGPKDASAVDQIRAKAIIEQIGIIGKDMTLEAREKTAAIAALMSALPGAERSSTQVAPTDAQIAALKSKAGDKKAIALWNTQFPNSPAEKYLTPAAPPAPAGIVDGETKRSSAPAKHEGNYGPLTSQAVIDRDAAAGVPAAVAYKKMQEERDQKARTSWENLPRSATGGMVME